MGRRVGIIGSVCDKLDGQTIKTKILYEELQKKTDWEFYIANTYYKTKNPLKLLWQTVRLLLRCKDVFVLVSQNGAKIYFPMLYVAGKVFKTRVYHDVIGGSPEDFVQNDPRNRTYLNSFSVNWVETKSMCRSLEAVGVTNAAYLPNFKRLNCMKPDDVRQDFGQPLPLCMFSRIMKEKGVEDAIAAVETINREAGRVVFTLDIYGNIDNGYRERFSQIMEGVTAAVSYKGLVPYDQSVEAIKDSFALLFPTFWFGEGFPGTLVDALSAGVPVIATDWSVNSEIISHGYTGLVYPNEQCKTLTEALYWALEHKEDMIRMRRNCIEEAKNYQPDAHVERIITKVEEWE